MNDNTKPTDQNPSPKRKSIRSLAPSVCEQCGGERTFLVTREKIECQRCGFVIRDSDGKPQPPAPAPKPAAPVRDLSQYRVSYYIPDSYEIEPYVESAYFTAMDHASRKQWPEAIAALRRCIDYRSDFAEAHLWLGRLLDDPQERREHLHQVLAYFPTHPEALRDLMILDGELTDSAEPFDEFTEAERREVNAPVAAETASKHKVNCPRCGAPNLMANGEDTLLSCAFCGYRDSERAAAKRHNSLAMALIKRRSQPVQWIVGERWLKCNSCGAARTLTQRQLSDHCPFCASKQVVLQDALKTIQQPDGLLPFLISQRQAQVQVEEALKGWSQRLAGILNNNRVARVEMEGVYLPFWVFDAVVQVQRSRVYTGSGQKWSRNEKYSVQEAYQQEQIPTARNNVMVCAVESPPRALTRQLGKYQLSGVQEYAPKFLAQHSAEIYTLDFDRAAMDAHEIISQQIHEEYQQSSSDFTITVTPMIQQMSFRLLLLPVWSVTIVEQDGDVRPALVNGQTGRVALGRARKPVV